GKVDAATGEVTGPVADIVKEIAKRIGVPFKIIPAPGVRDVLENVKSGSADFGFLAFDPTRAAEVDFTQSYSLAHNSYLVRADSKMQVVADVDQPGVKIAAVKGDTGELFLGRNLKSAKLNAVPGLTFDQAAKMLAASEIDAYGTNRQRLIEGAAKNPSVR